LIRPLRSAHRAIWTVLALALPAGLWAAISVRPEFSGGDPRGLAPRGNERVMALAAGAPDVLVYASAAPSSAELPPDARLLGRADGPLAIPGHGNLILYSLARRRVIAALPAAEVLP